MSINTNRQNNTTTIILTSVLTSILTSILTVAFSYVYAEYKANQILKQTVVNVDKNDEATKAEADLKGFPDVQVGMFAENDLIDISKKIGDMTWVHPNGKIYFVSLNGYITRVISPGHRDYNSFKN